VSRPHVAKQAKRHGVLANLSQAWRDPIYILLHLLWTDKKGVIKGYFNSHVKRRPFKIKWPIYYKQLTELLTSKMARGDHAGTIREALNKDLAWNRDNIDLNSSDYHNKDSEDPNIPRSIVKWSLFSTPINS